jgi:hypothetical protein
MLQKRQQGSAGFIPFGYRHPPSHFFAVPMEVGRAPVMMTNLQHFWILGLKNDPLFDRHYTPHRKTELLLAQVEPPRRPLALRVYRHARPTVPPCNDYRLIGNTKNIGSAVKVQIWLAAHWPVRNADKSIQGSNAGMLRYFGRHGHCTSCIEAFIEAAKEAGIYLTHQRL